MKVGFIGLGKLGLPVALAIQRAGHEVMGFDLEPSRMSRSPQMYKEAGPDGTGDFNEYLALSSVAFGTREQVAEHSEIIFLAVQTPHQAEFEGITPLLPEAADFDYVALRAAVTEIVPCIQKPTVIAIISTVLPGTMRREIFPVIQSNPNIELCYNPSFIAMGTTMRDFLDPEFVLLGASDPTALKKLASFYNSFIAAPILSMSVESAELCKVAYNTFIGLKIVHANTVMEICHKIPAADCDDVMNALRLADRRLISGAYMSGGMGDGGGCHPRDNIALSHLACREHLSYDLFKAVMQCRENQAGFLVELLVRESILHNLPIIILGYAFKPESRLIVGSPALLVANLLKREDIDVTLVDDSVGSNFREQALAFPAVLLIGCRHLRYRYFSFSAGSVVIDPHRYIPDAPGVTVIRIGEGAKRESKE